MTDEKKQKPPECAVQKEAKEECIWHTREKIPNTYSRVVIITDTSDVLEYTNVPWEEWEDFPVFIWAYKEDFLRSVGNAQID